MPMTTSWSFSLFNCLIKFLYSIRDFLTLVFGGLYPDTSRIFLLSVFNSTITCSNISVSICKSGLALDLKFLCTSIPTPPPILSGLCLLVSLWVVRSIWLSFICVSQVSHTKIMSASVSIMSLFNWSCLFSRPLMFR